MKKFELNRIVRNVQNFALLAKKWLTIFDKTVGRHFGRGSYDINNNLVTIIFKCSKIYGSPTNVTRLKFATNVAIPISSNEKGLFS